MVQLSHAANNRTSNIGSVSRWIGWYIVWSWHKQHHHYSKTNILCGRIIFMFIIGLAIILLFFVIPRLPWVINYPVAILNPDSFGYLLIVRYLLASQLPDLTIRSPIYLLYLSLVFQATSSIKMAIFIQNGFLLLCAFVFLWAVKKTYPKMMILAALVMAVQVGQPILVVNSLTIMTEAIFSGIIIVFCAFLVLGIGKNQPHWFFWAALAAGFAYLTHPRGIFLFAFLPLVIVYLFANHLPKRIILYSSIPILVSLVIIPGYMNIFNDRIMHKTQHHMKYSYIYCLTAPYWETDPNYPQQVNEDIFRHMSNRSQQELSILSGSWDGAKIYNIFYNAYQQLCQVKDTESYNVYFNRYLNLSPAERDDVGGRIALKAISSHPLFFVKFVWGSLREYFGDWVWGPLGAFYERYPKYLNEQYFPDGSPRSETYRGLFGDYSQLPKLSGLPVIKKKGIEQYVFVPSTAYRINAQFTYSVGVIFCNEYWFYVFGIIWTISLVMTIIHRFRHRPAFLLFTFGSLLILLGLIIPLSLISYAIPRYSSPVQFMQYLVVLFSPLLVMKQDPDIQ